MRRLRITAVFLCAALVAGCGADPTTAAQPAPGSGPAVSYYLSLGDSLSRGVQADPAGRSRATPDGYPDQLYALLRRRDPGLRLVLLGCSGETTGTMISGTHCPYRAGSQLAAAAAFLRAHPGHVSLITIDIGANDPNSCFASPRQDLIPPCFAGPAVPQPTVSNLVTILTRIRAAGGSRVRIIGMNYYVPELAEWRYGPQDRPIAVLSEQRAMVFNQKLARVYQSFGARIADVSGAFHTTDFGTDVTVPRFGRLPRNVAAVCRWTWACAAPPRGRNKHPNTAGYAVIARAFLAADR